MKICTFSHGGTEVLLAEDLGDSVHHEGVVRDAEILVEDAW